MQGIGMNDNEEHIPVYIIVGQARTERNGSAERIHVLLTAADDDTAVRKSLEALACEGYVEAELDQIGEISAMPDEEPHASAYQGALEGEIAIVALGSPGID